MPTDNTDLTVEEARFGAIRRDAYFWYQDKKWKRIRGRFATPVDLIGTGFVGVCFDLDTIVQKDLNSNE